mmetsp:Transcript_68508/g.103326  ORF Transcript_68508/g.103326 Transcript_68508/m.103326 type:complete len:173 (-) Transcript_68508:101-619(-)
MTFTSNFSRVCVGASVLAVGSAIAYKYLSDANTKRKSGTIFGIRLGREETLARIQEELIKEEQKLHRLEQEVESLLERRRNNTRKSLMQRLSMMFDATSKNNERRVLELINTFDMFAAQVDSVALSVWEHEKGANGRKLQLQAKKLSKRLDGNMERCEQIEAQFRGGRGPFY